MRERSWKVALAVVTLVVLGMALYIQLSERRTRQEADRLAVARMEKALAESRARIEALEQHRKDLAKKEAAEEAGDQPLPNAVLRRSESGRGSALQQVRDSQDEQETALIHLQESLDTLALQTERSDQALRQELQEIRAGVRRGQDASRKTLILLAAALVPLVLHLLISLRGEKG